MIGSSHSPSRMGLSPTRLDSYSSPAKRNTITSPGSKGSRATTASGKGYSESPLRSSGKGSLGFNSPKKKVTERSFSPNAHTKKLIKQIEAKYEPKRQTIMKSLNVVEQSKNEHY